MLGPWSLYLVIGMVLLAICLIKEGQENLVEKRWAAFVFDMIALVVVVGVIASLAGAAWSGIEGFL